jgi:hypothetical protein
MTTDEARDYLIDHFMPHEPWHVRVFMEGMELGKKGIKEKVVQQFKISHIDWSEYDRRRDAKLHEGE